MRLNINTAKRVFKIGKKAIGNFYMDEMIEVLIDLMFFYCI